MAALPSLESIYYIHGLHINYQLLSLSLFNFLNFFATESHCRTYHFFVMDEYY